MNEFFPGKKGFHNWRDGIGGSAPRRSQQRERNQLNWKAYVVCERYNNGWMSNVEMAGQANHGRPIIGKDFDLTISQSRAE